MKESTRTAAIIVALVLILLTIIAAGALFVFINRSNQQFNQELRNDVQALSQSVETLEGKIDDLEVEEMGDEDLEVNDFAPGTTLQEKDTTGMKLFESNLGFSFMYPEDWFVNEDSSSVLVAREDISSPLEITQPGIVVNISVEEVNENETVLSYLKKQDSRPNLAEGIKYSDPESIILDGVVQGYQRIEDTQRTDGIEGGYAIVTYAILQGELYEISGVAIDRATFDRYEDVYQDIVSSFKF